MAPAAIKYTIHDGEMVSLPWKTALVNMDKAGNNDVVEGHRTFARQQYFWDCYQSGNCNNGNLAAFPSHTAPHIATGQINHAIDFADGPKAERWLDSHGIATWRTVPGESWHAAVDAGDLRRYHEKNSADKWEVLPEHIEKDVRALIHHRHGAKATKGKDVKKYNDHVKWRKWHRKRLLDVKKRSDNPKTKALLHDLLTVDAKKHRRKR